MIQAQNNTQIAIANQLLNAGISFIPIGRNKQPAIRSWKQYQTNPPTLDEVREWFIEPDNAGIGVICGAVSGNLEVLDFDIRDSDLLEEFVDTWKHNIAFELGDEILDKLSMVLTPGPGVQFIYRCDETVGGSQKLAKHNGEFNQDSDGQKKPGYFIETRGEGGYSLSCGSPTWCHPNNKEYRHFSGPQIHELQSISADERDVLILEARWLGVEAIQYETPQEMKQALDMRSKESLNRKESHTQNLEILSGNVGDEFASNATWSEILEPHGFRCVGRENEKESWKRPGTQNQLSATTNHDGSNLFYAFSPNCHPSLETGRGYNKFAVYTALNFGDLTQESFRKATLELSDRGFGFTEDLSCYDRWGFEHDETNEAQFGFQSFTEFMSQIENVEYLCEDVIAKGQSTIIAGPEKSLKTGLMMDLAYSLSTATPFLGKFACPNAVTVGVMTGESNKPKLQRLLKTRSKSDSEIHLNVDSPKLHITRELPDLSQDKQMSLLRDVIENLGLEVLFIDPTYLCLGEKADKTSNVAEMGNLLRKVDAVSKNSGCTIILLHHTNRKHEPGKPLVLRDISGAGFSEWARQWILLCPRIPFDQETHQHRLWMVVGGSAGHAGRFAVDVREKDDESVWCWITTVRTEGEERNEYRQEKADRKLKKEREKNVQFVKCLQTSLNEGIERGGSTISELQQRFRDNGWSGIKEITTAKLQEFQELDLVKTETVKRGDNPKVIVWLPSVDWVTNTSDESEAIEV